MVCSSLLMSDMLKWCGLQQKPSHLLKLPQLCVLPFLYGLCGSFRDYCASALQAGAERAEARRFEEAHHAAEGAAKVC